MPSIDTSLENFGWAAAALVNGVFRCKFRRVRVTWFPSRRTSADSAAASSSGASNSIEEPSGEKPTLETEFREKDNLLAQLLASHLTGWGLQTDGMSLDQQFQAPLLMSSIMAHNARGLRAVMKRSSGILTANLSSSSSSSGRACTDVTPGRCGDNLGPITIRELASGVRKGKTDRTAAHGSQTSIASVVGMRDQA